MNTSGSYFDVAQIVLYSFWIFFACLIVYLRREDKREGYPLESDRSASITVQGFPAMPAPKVFKLANGHTYSAPPGGKPNTMLRATPSEPWPGAPLEPTGDPMQDAVGPASYAERQNVPDMTGEGEPMIVPLRVAHGFSVAAGDADPRGMEVVGADDKVAGTVHDIWVDRAEPQIRYLEVSVPTGNTARNVLLPITFARINGRNKQINVKSILAKHFAAVPGIGSADQVTRLEEDKICAYYAGGHLYAEPSRLGPVI